jgi:hypothetical protein
MKIRSNALTTLIFTAALTLSYSCTYYTPEG